MVRRGCIASQYYKVAAALKECGHGLQGVAIDDIKRACTVGRAGIVAEVQIVVLRHKGSQLTQDGESSIAGVEYPYWT